MTQPTKEQLASIRPVEILSSYDIRKVVSEFMPNRTVRDDKISTVFEGVAGESGEKVMFSVSAPLGCDIYSQFMQGMKILKARVDAIEKHGEAARKTLMIDGHTWVDNIIKTKFGGKRDGLRIRWDISEGTFFFDPFTGRLTKCESSPTS